MNEHNIVDVNRPLMYKAAIQPSTVFNIERYVKWLEDFSDRPKINRKLAPFPFEAGYSI